MRRCVSIRPKPINANGLAHKFADRTAFGEEWNRSVQFIDDHLVGIDSKGVVDGGEEVAGAEGVVADLATIGRRRPDHLAGFQAATGESGGKRPRPMAAPRLGIDSWASSKFAICRHEHAIQ